MGQKEEVQPLQIDIQNDDDEVSQVFLSYNKKSSITRLSLIICASILFFFIGYFTVSGTYKRLKVDNDTNNATTTYTTPPVQFTVYKDNGTMFQTLGNDLMHDKHHFTQGLTYSRSSDMLFESNGLFGQSTVCKLNPNTGETLTCIPMEKRFFAEGMQVYGKPGNEKLIQITWKSRFGFIYNAETLEMIRNFTFSTVNNQGWGICYDEMNHEFIVSDGSHYLHFWDSDSLKEKRRVAVTRQNGGNALRLNELEFVNGRVLANVWYEDVILVIDPKTGDCQSEYDMSSLWLREDRKKNGADVLNGISISKQDGILYVTGKNWDRMFRVKLEGF